MRLRRCSACGWMCAGYDVKASSTTKLEHVLELVPRNGTDQQYTVSQVGSVVVIRASDL